MNSKERVLRSIDHREVDRCPYYYFATRATNEALRKHLQISASDGDIAERLGCDVQYIGPRLIVGDGPRPPIFQAGSVHAVLYDKTGKQIKQALPLEEATTVEEVHEYPHWPSPDSYEYELPASRRQALHDKAVVAYDMGIVFLYAMGMRGIENIMIDMAGDPDMAHAIFHRIAAFNLERTRRFLAANPGVIDMVGVGDDVAGQDGLLLSPAMWREYLKPHLEAMVQLCREFDVIPYFHGCGGFRALFEDLSNMGIPCVGKLQTEAAGNDFTEVKHRFGETLCLWGAIDAQHILIEGKEQDVRSHVQCLLRESAGTGYVAGPTHSFTEDTPLENILAVYDVLSKGQMP